jgi:hypothetical protein
MYRNWSWAVEVRNRCTGGWGREQGPSRSDVVMIEDLVSFVETIHTHVVPGTSARTLVVVVGLSSQSTVTGDVSAWWIAVLSGFRLAGVAAWTRTFARVVIASRGLAAAAIANLGTVAIETCKWSWGMDLGQARRRSSRVIKGS